MGALVSSRLSTLSRLLTSGELRSTPGEAVKTSVIVFSLGGVPMILSAGVKAVQGSESSQSCANNERLDCEVTPEEFASCCEAREAEGKEEARGVSSRLS